MKQYRSLAEIQTDLQSHAISVKQLVEAYLQRVEEKKHLNAFLEVFASEALENAEQIDAKLAENKAGGLAGMVIGLKDNICYKGHKVSASSKILEGFESLYSATVVERLLAEDAIIIGRLNCDEFAMGSSNENSAFGNVLNPLNEKKVPGGSSGGSATAVAAGLCLATLGSDTGGSIRQPASFCGLVGLKPTYGRVSRYGLIAYASSFDQIGTFTHTIEDASLLLEIMAGKDEYDSTLSSEEVPKYSKALSFSKKTNIAYYKSYVEHEGLDPEIKKRFFEIIEKLKQQGHSVTEHDFPFLDYLVPAYYVLTTAEASSNLARYDGIHYGYRSNNATDLNTTYTKSRSEGFGPEVKRRIMLGTYVLSAGYYDAYYTQAQKVRRILRDKTNEVLSTNDFILLPTTPHTAFDIGQQVADPIKMYLEDIYTVQANLTGLPAISLPLGKHSNNMPFGLQLMGKSFCETEMFSFAKNLINL
ncbi:MAG: Asp-tRNA(Asn)/Glu-tRNA(Gln) amidotransferase subunit GatA [Flavobacteriales bacterium]|nr:Asp-tRNA(Asn)/Glu-tRNA(Gln) amidotransferase subunit GatA [Flavobacteriales bacterium]